MRINLKNKLLNKSLSVSVALIILFSQIGSFTVWAEYGGKAAAVKKETENQPEKDEIIYAKLATDGTLTNAYAVNRFLIKQERSVVDYGIYDQVINLTDQRDLERQGDRVVFKGKPGAFFYQGNLGRRPMPWDFKLTYRLNGKDMAPQDIVDHDGQLTIMIEIKRNKSEKEFARFHRSFMLQTTVKLHGENVEIINAAQATPSFAGSKKQLNYILFPNTDAKYVINAKGEKWQIEPVQIAGIPYKLDPGIKLPNAKEIAKQFAPLHTGLAQLADGMRQLADGINEGQNGVAELDDGMHRLADNGYKISDGIYSLANGLNTLDNGMGQFSDGLQQLADGSGELAGGIRMMNDELDKVVSPENLDKLGKTIKRIIDDLKKVLGDFLPPDNASLREMKKTVSERLPDLKNWAKNLNAWQTKLSELDNSLAAMNALQTADKTGAAVVTSTAADADLAELKGMLNELKQKVAANTETTTITVKSAAGNDKVASAVSDKPAATNEKSVSDSNEKSVAVDEQGAVKVNNTVPANDKAMAPVEATKALLNEQPSQADTQHYATHTIKSIDPQINALITKIEQQVGKLEEAVKIERQESNKMRQDEHAKVEKLTAMAAKVRNISSELRKNSDEMSKFSLDELLKQVEKTLNSVDKYLNGGNDISEVLGNLRELRKYLNKDFNLSEVIDKLKEFKSGVSKLADGAERLHEGAVKLNANFGLMYSGVGQAEKGAWQLYGGFNSYLDGVNQAAGGVDKLNDGMTKLAGGATALADGSKLAADKTADLSPIIEREMKKITANLMPENYKAESFISQHNLTIRSVQFVFMSEEPAEAPVSPKPDVSGSKTLWQRLKSLFGLK